MCVLYGIVLFFMFFFYGHMGYQFIVRANTPHAFAACFGDIMIVFSILLWGFWGICIGILRAFYETISPIIVLLPFLSLVLFPLLAALSTEADRMQYPPVVPWLGVAFSVAAMITIVFSGYRDLAAEAACGSNVEVHGEKKKRSRAIHVIGNMVDRSQKDKVED